MMRLLLILIVLGLVVIPAVEITTFIHVGGRIGALPTIVLTILTAGLGIALVRMQGIIAMADVQRAMLSGRAPFIEMLSGALLALAGVLLLIPGFVTDAIGFLLLIPPLRRAMAALLGRALFRQPPAAPGAGPGTAEGSRIIEVEIVEVQDNPEPPPPPRRIPPQSGHKS